MLVLYSQVLWYLHVPKHQKAIVVTGYKPVDNFNIAELWSFKLSDLGIPGVKLTICARGVTSGAKFETIASGTTRWPNLQSRQVAPLSVVKDLLDWVCCASIYDMLSNSCCHLVSSKERHRTLFSSRSSLRQAPVWGPNLFTFTQCVWVGCQIWSQLRQAPVWGPNFPHQTSLESTIFG